MGSYSIRKAGSWGLASRPGPVPSQAWPQGGRERGSWRDGDGEERGSEEGDEEADREGSEVSMGSGGLYRGTEPLE